MVVGKRGNRDPRKGWKLAKRAGQKRRQCYALVNLKAIGTLKNYRKGLHFMWKDEKTRRKMKRIGLKDVGGYDAKNQLAGGLPATAAEIQFLTNSQVQTLMWAAYEQEPTPAQLKKVRAFFSFCYQLQTGEVNGNFECVEKKRKLLAPCGLAPKKGTGGKATTWLDPPGMKIVTTEPWHYHPDWPLPRFSANRLIAYDYYLNAGRTVCLERTKESRTHKVNYEQRYMWTQMKGGRAKREKRLEVMKWRMYRVCSCKGGKHRGLPRDYAEQRALFDDKGFPKEQPNWNTGCPLSCHETIQHFMTRRANLIPDRVYPKWYSTTHRFGESYGRKLIPKEMAEFLIYIGANPDKIKFSKNAGRKANGALCDEFRIPFTHTLNWHGDRPRHWRKHYQRNLPQIPDNFQRRHQSKNPLTAIKGHVGILQRWGFCEGMTGFRAVPKEEPEEEKEMKVEPPSPEIDAMKTEINVLKQELGEVGALRKDFAALKELMMQVLAQKKQ